MTCGYTFTGERCRIRKINAGDAQFIVELYNEPSFKLYIGDRKLSGKEDGEAFIEHTLMKSYQPPGFGMFLVESRKTGQPIGLCGVLLRDNLDLPDLGFGFLERFCGKGYAGEAAGAFISYAKRYLGLMRLGAITSPDNARSIRFLEKLGFVLQADLLLDAYDGPSKWFVLEL